MTTSTTPLLTLGDRPVETMFDLMGRDEEDMTNGLGWVLANSPSFLGLFLRHVASQRTRGREARIRLQGRESGSGITDVEIIEPDSSLVIVEAKKGWTLPPKSQLGLYSKRFEGRWANPKNHRMVVLSDCSREYAQLELPKALGNDVALRYANWARVRELLHLARSEASNAEKRLMQDFDDYLAGVRAMPRNESNLVYVVSLGGGSPEGWQISWRDIVLKRRGTSIRSGDVTQWFPPTTSHSDTTGGSSVSTTSSVLRWSSSRTTTSLRLRASRQEKGRTSCTSLAPPSGPIFS